MKPGSFALPILLSTVALVAIGFESCSKSNNGAKPQISIKSLNTTVPPQGTLDVLLEFTSSANDLSTGTFVAIRNRLNQKPLPPSSSNADTLVYPIPSFPDQNKGEFKFSIDYNYLHESPDSDPDTIIFKFAAIDRNKHSSDTISSPQIVILSQ